MRFHLGATVIRLPALPDPLLNPFMEGSRLKSKSRSLSDCLGSCLISWLNFQSGMNRIEVNSLSAVFTSGLQMGYTGKKHNIVRSYDD